MDAYSYEYDNENLENEDDDENTEEFTIETSDRNKNNAAIFSTEIDGMVRLNLSELTQKIVGCKIGEDVTTEYPWVFVKKEIIEDNLDLHIENSDFFPIRNDILKYPDGTMLIGLAPNTTNDPEFYVCLTTDSRNTVINKINFLRNDQENRVKQSVFRRISAWYELGSSKEIDCSSIKKMRSLLQIEIVMENKFWNVPIQLVDRNAEEQRDGYIELIAKRQSFNNMTRRLMSRGEDTNPIICNTNTQTSALKPINTWFQYNYDYEPINTKTYNDEEAKDIEKFLYSHTKDLCDNIIMNTAWDIHTDDCKKLIKNERDIQVPIPVIYTEFQSYHNIKITKNKVINDLCWHPLWTGIAIAAYTNYSKSHNFTEKNGDSKILKGSPENNYVLVWSFNDCLMPKLMLECLRQVTTVSVRPLDGNIVIGGCDNGQIVMWSIQGEIEKTEAVTVTTTAQVKYKTIFKNLMNWMKEPTGSATIHPSSISSIQRSQRSSITQIIWLPTHTKVGKNGRLIEIKEDMNTEELGWQFMTSSEDGTVAFWDLRIQENAEEITINHRKKQDSEQKVFDKSQVIDQPLYMLTIKHPEEERHIVITTMSFYVPKHEKIQIEPFSKTTDIATRKFYKPVIVKPNHEILRIILIGTLEGDVGTITWDGFEFTTGLTMNREVATWIWCNTGIHDGPVTHSVRSKYLNDVIVTIGGKVFAVWREDFSIPVFMKKSTIRYTACSWGTSRPTLIILARADGTVEIWDLIVKSHEACFTQNISGRIVTGIYTHELYLNPQCIAFCDFNGAMRVVIAPQSLSIFEKGDVEWMRSFIDREVDRIREFQKWQRSGSKESTYNKERLHRQTEQDGKLQNKKPNTEGKGDQREIVKINEKIVTDQRREPIEEAKNHWKLLELKRMQRIILEKKGLRADDLDKRLAPVFKLRRGENLKKKKIQDILLHKDKVLEETINFSFPEWNQSHVSHSFRTNATQVDGTHDATDPEKAESIEMEQIIPQVDTTDTKFFGERIMKEYERITNETLGQLSYYSFGESFDLQEMINEGERKRLSLDVELKKISKKRPKALK